MAGTPVTLKGGRLAGALEAARFQELAELRETSLVPSWSDDVRGL